MKTTIRIAAFAGIVLASFGPNAPSTDAQEDNFSPQNQLVDTSILFAAGAREEEQTLRGALGWPTFQEGQVLGVHYRFDPDAYARFGPTPTLDNDFFEVLCHPATRLCTATKQPIQIWMKDRETPRLSIRGISRNTHVYASDGASRIELPPDLLAELAPSVEQALLNASELVLETEGEAPRKISLAGFIPALVYIQWVAREQDPSVFPTGWPVAQSTSSEDRLSLAPKTPDAQEAGKDAASVETALSLQPPARIRPALAPLSWRSQRREGAGPPPVSALREVADTDRIEGLLKVCESLAPVDAARAVPAAQPKPDLAAEEPAAVVQAQGATANDRSIRELQWAVLKLSIMISAMERQMRKPSPAAREGEAGGSEAAQTATEIRRAPAADPTVSRAVPDDQLRLLLETLSDIRLPSPVSSTGRGAAAAVADDGRKPGGGAERDVRQAPEPAVASATPGHAASVQDRPRKVIIEIRLTGLPAGDGKEDEPSTPAGPENAATLSPGSAPDVGDGGGDFFPLEPAARPLHE